MILYSEYILRYTLHLFQDITPFQDVLQLGENDVCLSNIDALYMFGDKKRKLIPGRNITEKVKGLHIVCKVMLTI